MMIPEKDDFSKTHFERERSVLYDNKKQVVKS